MNDNHGIVKPCLCPHCGYMIDCATGASSPDIKPRGGDFSMCLKCGGLLRYNDDLTVRSMVDEDWAELSVNQIALINKMRSIQKSIPAEKFSNYESKT